MKPQTISQPGNEIVIDKSDITRDIQYRRYIRHNTEYSVANNSKCEYNIAFMYGKISSFYDCLNSSSDRSGYTFTCSFLWDSNVI